MAQVIDQLCCIKHNYLSKQPRDERNFSSWLFYLKTIKHAGKNAIHCVTKQKLNVSIRGYNHSITVGNHVS